MANEKYLDILFKGGKVNIPLADQIEGFLTGGSKGTSLSRAAARYANTGKLPLSYKVGQAVKTGAPKMVRTGGGIAGGITAGLNELGAYNDIQKANMIRDNKIMNAHLYDPVDLRNSERFYRDRAKATNVGTGLGALGGLPFGSVGIATGAGLGGTIERAAQELGAKLHGFDKKDLVDPYAINEIFTITKTAPVKKAQNKKQQPTTSTNKNKNTSNSLNKYSNIQRGGGGMSPDFVNNLVATKGLNAGVEPSDIEIGEAEQLDTTPQSTAIDGVLEYMRNRQDKLQPYMDKLNEFVDNYKDYNKGYEDTDIFFRGLAGWTGNPAWATYAKDHNPASTEATQIDLYRKLAEQDLAEEDKYQEILGNIAMAEAMGLPPEAALANPKMISNNIQMQKLQQTLQTRREIANLNAREKELDRQARIAMKQGDWKNAQLLQGMRNEASMKRTILEGASYGDPANINNALKALGYGIRLDNTGNGEVSY